MGITFIKPFIRMKGLGWVGNHKKGAPVGRAFLSLVNPKKLTN